jgi:hypothetical protein
VPDRAIAGRLDRRFGKSLFRRLQFLEADDIGARFLEPTQQDSSRPLTPFTLKVAIFILDLSVRCDLTTLESACCCGERSSRAMDIRLLSRSELPARAASLARVGWSTRPRAGPQERAHERTHRRN